MGFLRDAGAALTMGLSATTKHKEAEIHYLARQAQHQQTVEKFNELDRWACEAIDQLSDQYLSVKDTLIRIGALTVDDAGNTRYGWYRPHEAVQSDSNNPEVIKSVIGSLPGFGTAIGAPAAVWTLVGALGTAGTGVAISSLSGAAAGAATAAWIGRVATLGMGGMTAGRIALGPIALISLPVQGAIGAKIAGNRERNAIKAYAKAEQKMGKVDLTIQQESPNLSNAGQKARQITTDMTRHVGQAETAQPGSQDAQDAVARLATDMSQAEELIKEFARIHNRIESDFGD